MSGVKGDNSIKIFGPDIDKLELLADKARHVLQDIRGVANVGIFHVRDLTTCSSVSIRSSARSGA